MRYQVLGHLLSLLAVVGTALVSAQTTAKPPNILIFIADDHGREISDAMATLPSEPRIWINWPRKACVWIKPF